jgi:hypothetical protein
VAIGGFSLKRLGQVREALERYVDSGFAPGGVAAVASRRGPHRGNGHSSLRGRGLGRADGRRHDLPHSLDNKADRRRLRDDARRGLHAPPRRPGQRFPPGAGGHEGACRSGRTARGIRPANRPVTLRDLLTITLGTGIVPAEPGRIPIADALNALQSEKPEQAPASSCETAMPPDKWIRWLGTLPLVYQPGERWMYNTAANVTGVLIAHARGMSFGDALSERICEPLGMKDTGFTVAGQNISRLATLYHGDEVNGEVVIEDGPDGYWSRPPAFEDGGGGLVSTISDYLAFASALLAGGTYRGERVLSRPSVT